MRKLQLVVGISVLFLLMAVGRVYGQFCSGLVPTFTVNLSGAPDSTWISPPTARFDTCCGVTSPDRCVQFIVTLDSNANGIIMDIPEGGGCGARPTGSLFYQVNCGPPVAIGTPVCLSGPGPHFITFCKPGNNDNCYQITSVPAPDASGDVVTTDGCNAMIGTVGYMLSTITWSSIPPNPIHEGYLSCTTGCDTVTVTAPPVGAPPSVTYQVCGRPLGSCDTTPVCDTMTVFFVSTLGVVIQPDSPSVCFGSGTTTITAVPTGGAAPFAFNWTSGGLPVGSSGAIAVGPGTYEVAITDTLACTIARDTVTVIQFSLPIQALAGNDSAICRGTIAFLAGQVVAAGGGVWHGGTGTFTPNNTTLNAQYTPSPAEIAAGFVNLTLVTTQNYSCPADSDVVHIDIRPYPAPVIAGPAPVCEFTTTSYSTPLVAGNSYTWTVTGGTIAGGQGTNAISVNWGAAGPGTVTVTEVNPTTCDSTISLSLSIHPKPSPLIAGATPVCQYDVDSYATPFVAGAAYVWTVSGGTIVSGQGTNAISVQWGAPGAGTVSVNETNSFGCDTTVSFAVVINPKPAAQLLGPTSVCAFTSVGYSGVAIPGTTFSWAVTGGTILSGQNTGAIVVTWGAAGVGSVSLTQANALGCDTTITRTITINPHPVAAVNGPIAVCAFDAGIIYSTPPSVGATYTWTVTGGSIVGGQGTPSASVNWSAAGTGTVVLTVALPTGCDTTITRFVGINPIPQPGITGPLNVCNFDAASYSTAPVVGNTFVWTATGGTVTAGQGTNAVTVTWGAAGVGTLSVHQSSALGCDSTVSIAVNINPTPQPTISGQTSVCEFTGGHSYSVLSVPNHTYAWSVVGGTLVSGQGTNAITVFWGVTGNGSISVTQTAPASAAGCDTTVTQNILIHPKPNPVITGPASVCANDIDVYSTPAAPGSLFIWTVTGGSISSGQNTSSVTVQWGAAGAGSVTVQQFNSFGCDTTVAVAVTINPLPTPAITGTNAPCAWSSANYSVVSVVGNAYTWTVTGGGLASGQGTNAVTVNWQGAGAGTVSVVQSTPAGCSTTVNLPITINPNPTAAITGPAVVCEYQSLSYSSPANAGATYTWTVTGGNIASGQGTNAITVGWSASGAGSVSLLVSFATGCDTTVALPVLINPNPDPLITGITNVCAFTPQPYSVPLVAGHTYLWTVGGGTITSGQGTNAVTVQWGSAGAGLVTLLQTAPTGCDSLTSLNIVINPTPQPVISGPATVCEFTGGHTYSTPAAPGHTYLWSVAGGNITSGQGTNSISVYWNAAGAGTVTLTQTAPITAAGCDTTIVLNIIIHPKPNPVITGPTTVCALSAGIGYSVPAVGGDTYVWTVTGGTITSGQGTNSIGVTWGAPGAASLTVQQTNPQGCDTTVTVAVTLLPQPTPTITGPSPVCATATQQAYSTPLVTGNGYVWSVVGGTIASGQGSNAILVNWGGVAGTGTITLTESHPQGCDSTVTLDVILDPAPIPVIVGDSVVCAYTAVTYTSNPDPLATITWSVAGNGTIVSGQGTTSITVNWAGPGNEVVSVHYLYANGCEATVTHNILIQTAPVPLIIGQDTVCQYQSNVFSTPFVPGVNYIWTPVGGVVIAGQGTASATVQWGVAGNFSLQLEAIVPGGCDTTMVIPVTVLPGPDARIVPEDMIICEPGLVQWDGTLSVGETAYFWNLGNGGTSNEPAPTSGYWLAGNYTIRLITDGAYQCRDTAYAHLTVLPGPHAEFQILPDQTLYGDDDTASFVNYSTQAVFYDWDFGDSTGDTAMTPPTHFYELPGDYVVTLTVTDSMGCTDTYTQTLTVIYDLNLYVPTAFTPNGDGLNDFFNVSHWNVLDFHIEIYSRWGERIYESFDKDFQWNGHYHDEACQEGVYVFKIDATVLGGKKVYRSGTVTLIR